MNYTSKAEKSFLLVTPRELNISNSMFNADVTKLKEFYLPLVLKTPCNQSMYGLKISNMQLGDGWKKSKKINTIINEIMKLTGINNSFYLYNSFNSSKNKVNLKSHILSDGGPCLYLKNDNGILESLFFCLRNSLSHGDVIYRNGYYEFFSVKKENKDDYEIDGRVVFYMKIKSINQLKGFLCIEKYL